MVLMTIQVEINGAAATATGEEQAIELQHGVQNQLEGLFPRRGEVHRNKSHLASGSQY
jgi:hypothetical protein